MSSGNVDSTKSGSLVAVEGDADVISTQLRLLPPSTKILVLPPLKDSIERQTDNENVAFSARRFVRNVHTAYSDRVETARSFLEGSTSAQPRLVFMNGGCVSARTTCITTICENVTNGEIREAEKLFLDIVKDGVSGLMTLDGAEDEGLLAEIDDEVDGENKDEAQEDVEMIEDPGTAAMKAAEKLDRGTAGLQPYVEEDLEDLEDLEDSMEESSKYHLENSASSSNESENRSAFHSNVVNPLMESRVAEPSSSIPSQNEFEQDSISEKFRASRISQHKQGVFTTDKGDTIRRTVLTILSHSTSLSERRSPYFDDDSDLDIVSPNQLHRYSAPVTPNIVEYGEAKMIDLTPPQKTKTKVVKRTKSVDRFYSRRSFLMEPKVDIFGLKQCAAATPESAKGSPSSVGFRAWNNEKARSFETLPRTAFMRASQTTIRKSTSFTLAASTSRVYVDSGTDAEEPNAELVDEEEVETESFSPVFPILEDLIIHFNNSPSNEIFDSVIRSYKNGSFPVFPTAKSEAGASDSRPSTAPGETRNLTRPFSNITAETDDDDYHRSQEVDPYNPDSYQPTTNRLWPAAHETKNFAHMTSLAEPPTPASTPPPTLSPIEDKFHEFSPVNANSAVGIQNSFRAVLNVHFSPETTSYRQYEYPAENDRFWKQMFRNDEGMKSEERTVDQILAFGSDDGVSKDMCTEICAQVEKLGTKRNGISRTGKLDIRYLISNVLQTQTGSSLIKNPFSNADLLATLLVPQLETYLSHNASTRFLILTFPSSHLPIMMSLRKLLGTDLLKIAGILDVLASDPPSSLPLRSTTPKPLNLLSNEGAAAINSRMRFNASATSLARTRAELQRQVTLAGVTASKTPSTTSLSTNSFSKANYLLPSTASDSEIATFVSNIWKPLGDKSSFYNPEPEFPRTATPNSITPPPIPLTPTSQTAEHTPRSPLGMAPPAGHTRTHSRARSFKSPKIEHILLAHAHSQSQGLNSPPHHRNASRETATLVPEYPASIMTTSTERDRERDRKERQSERDWANFNMGDDSEDDEWERQYLPRVPKRVELGRKVNSRKALKWLGLS